VGAPQSLDGGVGHRNGGDEALRVFVLGGVEHALGLADLDESTLLEHADPVRE
jgi:hypothetical protein